MSKISDMYEQIKSQQHLLVRTKLQESVKASKENRELSEEERKDYEFDDKELAILIDLLKEKGLEKDKDFIKLYESGYSDEPTNTMLILKSKDGIISILTQDWPGIKTMATIISREELEGDIENFFSDDIEEVLKKITSLNEVDIENIGISQKTETIEEKKQEILNKKKIKEEEIRALDIELYDLDAQKWNKEFIERLEKGTWLNKEDYEPFDRKNFPNPSRNMSDLDIVDGMDNVGDDYTHEIFDVGMVMKIDDSYILDGKVKFKTLEELIEFCNDNGFDNFLSDTAEYDAKNDREITGLERLKSLTNYTRQQIIDELNGKEINTKETRNIRESFEESLLRDDVVEYYLSKTPEELEAELGPEVARMVGFEQKNSHHCYDLWEHTLRTVEGISPEGLTPEQFKKLRVAAFFHDIGKPDVSKFNEKTGQQVFYGHAMHSVDVAKIVLEQLGYNSDEIEQLSFYIGHHDDFISYKSKTAPWMKNHEFMRGIDSDTVSEKIIENQYDFKAMGYNDDQIRYICYALGHDGQDPTFATKDGPIDIKVDMAEVQEKIDSGKYDASYIPSEADYKLLLELCKADARAQSEVAMQQGRVVGSKKEKLENMNNIQNSIPEAFKSVIEKVTGYSFEKFIKDSVPQAYGEKRPPVICKDGTEYSIQASSFHACLPKEDGLEAYDEFEVYVMSDVEDLAEFINYDGVAGNVPKEVIEGIIKAHGGLDKKVMRERVQAQKDVFKPKDEAYEKWLEEASNGNPFVAQMLRYATRRVEVRGQDEQAKKLEEQYGEQLPKGQHTVDDNE